MVPDPQKLPDEADEGAEEAWEAEIARRTEELDAGSATTVPWAEVRRELLARRTR